MNYSRARRAPKSCTKGRGQSQETKVGPSPLTAHSRFPRIKVLPISSNREGDPDSRGVDTTWLTKLGLEFAFGFSATHIPGTQNFGKRSRRVFLGPPMPDLMVIVPTGAKNSEQTRIIAAAPRGDYLEGQSAWVPAAEWPEIIQPQTTVPLKVTSQALEDALAYAERIGVGRRWREMISKKVQEAANHFYSGALPSYLLQQALEQLEVANRPGGPQKEQMGQLIDELLAVQGSLARKYQEEIRAFIEELREGGVKPDFKDNHPHARRRLRTIALASTIASTAALLGGANQTVHNPSVAKIGAAGVNVAHVSEMELPLALDSAEATREPYHKASTLGDLAMDFSNRLAIHTEVNLQNIIDKIATSPQKFGEHLLQALEQSGFSEAEIEQFIQGLLGVALGLGVVGSILNQNALRNLQSGKRGAALGLLAITILTTACGGIATPTPTPVLETPTPTPTPRPVNTEMIDINNQTGFQYPIRIESNLFYMQYSFYVGVVPPGGNWTNTINQAGLEYYRAAISYNPERTLTYADGKTEILEARDHLVDYALGLPWTIVLQGHYQGAPVLIEVKPGDKAALEFLTRFGIGPWPGDKVLIGHEDDTVELETLARVAWPDVPLIKVSYLIHVHLMMDGKEEALRVVEVKWAFPDEPLNLQAMRAGTIVGGGGEWYIYDPKTGRWVLDEEAFNGDFWDMLQKYSSALDQ